MFITLSKVAVDSFVSEQINTSLFLEMSCLGQVTGTLIANLETALPELCKLALCNLSCLPGCFIEPAVNVAQDMRLQVSDS